MGDNEILEIKNLDDDNLLELYDMVQNHIQYLESAIISEDEDVQESEGTADE